MTQHQISTALKAAEEYGKSLDELSRTTASLLHALTDPDAETIELLLREREVLCDAIARSTASLTQAIRKLGDPDKLCSTDAEIARDSLRIELDRMQTTRADILKKQSECEALLALRLKEREAELLSLHQDERLRTVYQPPGPSDQARFLDSTR